MGKQTELSALWDKVNGLATKLASLARGLGDHEKHCKERWDKNDKRLTSIEAVQKDNNALLNQIVGKLDAGTPAVATAPAPAGVNINIGKKAIISVAIAFAIILISVAYIAIGDVGVLLTTLMNRG